MPTLDWIGKKAVVNHHREVPYRLLRCDSNLSAGNSDAGNLLVQGDNLLALKALLPYYAGKVKCIYIDPPYNTGSENWVYNDNVNSPEIRQWLGKVVGSELEDLTRHDKWLCMMYPRLSLLREFLCKDGMVFIQIGNEESGKLRLLLDEIFGENNFRNEIIVRRGTKNVQSQFDTIDSLAVGHDIIYLYSKSPDVRLLKLQHNLEESEAGKWDTFWRGTDRPTMRYELFGNNPEKGQWRWSKDKARIAVENYNKYLRDHSAESTLDEFYSERLTRTGNELDFVRLGPDNTVQYYVSPRSYKIISDVWLDVSTRGTHTLFPHEKNIELLSRIIGWVAHRDDIVMDSFGGSGSTGHAVLSLNKADGGSRQFILVHCQFSSC